MEIFSDPLFCANFCYFDKPMFEYTEQQVGVLFKERYSNFEIKKIIKLYKEYKALTKPVFKTSYNSDLLAVHLTTNTRIQYYKKRGFCEVIFNNKPLLKTFENDTEAIEYFSIYYPKFILNKKHLIF